MTQKRYVDRVITVHADSWESSVRLADHTPHSGYTALAEAADDAGIDVQRYADAKTIAVAVLGADGDVEAFHPEGRKTFDVRAQDTDSPEDAGFNVFFERPYDWRAENLPVTEDAVVRATEEAYGCGDPERMAEEEKVGVLVTDDDGEYVDFHFTK